MVRNKNAAAIGWCETCQKLLYTDRKRARTVARQHHPHKNTYPCPVRGDLWHVGSLHEAIKHGHVTRDEYYGGGAA
jgi:hypothetical protein